MPEQTRAARLLWRLGAVTQGLVLGVLVVIALVNLYSVANDPHIFRYQGF